jgi:L-amino acid N-acyltransferase YncA
MNVRIRPAILGDADLMAKVHVDMWRSAYSGIVPADFLSHLSYQARESGWSDILGQERPATSIFVAATTAGEVVGFASGGPEWEGNQTYPGELYVIYLLEKHQGQGVVRGLFSAVTQRLLTAGIRSMLVWVLEDNLPACKFYESLGGERVSRKMISFGDVELPEVSYGWKEVANLAGAWPVSS